MPELCVCTSCVLDSRAAVSNQGALYIRDAERGPKMGDFTWWLSMVSQSITHWTKRAAAFFEAFRPPTSSRNFVSDRLKSINTLFVPPTTTFPLSPQASRYVFFTFSLLHTPPRLFYPIFLLSVGS